MLKQESTLMPPRLLRRRLRVEYRCDGKPEVVVGLACSILEGLPDDKGIKQTWLQVIGANPNDLGDSVVLYTFKHLLIPLQNILHVEVGLGFTLSDSLPS